MESNTSSLLQNDNHDNEKMQFLDEIFRVNDEEEKEENKKEEENRETEKERERKLIEQNVEEKKEIKEINKILIDEDNMKKEKTEEKQNIISEKNSEKNEIEEIKQEKEINNQIEKEEVKEKNDIQSNVEIVQKSEEPKKEENISEKKKEIIKKDEKNNITEKEIEKESFANKSLNRENNNSRKESNEINNAKNLKSEENNKENETDDILNVNNVKKEPIINEEDKHENNDSNNAKKITEGVNIFNNYINIQYKMLFINLLKQRTTFLLKINNAFITLENTISKIKLLHKKKYFMNILSKSTLNIKKKKRSSIKQKNILLNENANSPNNSKTNSKIKNKIKKLEFIKQRETEYINMIEKQKQKKQEVIENINLKIKKSQKLEEMPKKDDDIFIISDRSSSNLSGYFDTKNNFNNGFEILIFLFKKNIQKNKIIFLENLNEKISMKKNNNKKIVIRNKIFSTKKILSKNYDEIKPKYLNKTLDKNEHKSISNTLELEEEVESNNRSGFITLNEPNYELKKKTDKKQLSEYDLFYKEQFFQNELFVYDVENIEDKVEAEIKKEMTRLNLKQKLIAKKKLKEVNDLKNLNTKQLQLEINDLQEKYNNIKKKAEPKLKLEMNNTEGFLHFGRMLGNYFSDEEEIIFPKFALESEKQTAARDVIDFKLLRKEEVARRYFDYCCCLEQRKKINKILVYARYFCRFFVDNWIFDNLSLLIIIINTILILISDPTDPNNIGNTYDNYFLIFYTLEAILKIISFRFIRAEDAYIKDAWNILDFFVVIIGWISFILERAMNGTKISGLAGLRAFRILRPFKTVKRFKGLKKLVTALLASIGHLGETSIVLFFFF